MSITAQALGNLVVIFNALTPADTGGPICSYIDPNTMHHVFSFLGPVIAVFVTLLSLTASIFVLFRDRLVNRFAKGIRFRPIVTAIVLICVLIGLAAVVVRLFQNQVQGN